MTASPGLFSWLRGLDDPEERPNAVAMRRLWSLVLDVVEAADRLSENAGAGIPWPKVERLRDTLTAFYEAAEKERA